MNKEQKKIDNITKRLNELYKVLNQKQSATTGTMEKIAKLISERKKLESKCL
jgi:hypothetical protein